MTGATREDVMQEVQALRMRAKRKDRPKEVAKLVGAALIGAAVMWLALALLG